MNLSSQWSEGSIFFLVGSWAGQGLLSGPQGFFSLFLPLSFLFLVGSSGNYSSVSLHDYVLVHCLEFFFYMLIAFEGGVASGAAWGLGEKTFLLGIS